MMLDTVRGRRAACLALVTLATVLMLAATAAAQGANDTNAKTFEGYEPCKSFATEVAAITEDSKRLDNAMPARVESQNELLAAIFEGTQVMLAFGERMFEASDKFEEKCKAALREADQGALIFEIYDRILEPTMRGYDFLVRVRDSAQALGDEQTVADMNAAIDGYKDSARKLVDACKSDLPEDVAEARCGELARRLDARLR